ncbi:pantoate--beta-alanine ligase [Proteinivorax hydrogeniformans]|uniref:Pantothenate synthetase n=1 Tax=Proteinivorax hydrogeniformans TaxID=1826727 RepID=A0AAU8HVX9_9FIRM
MKIINSIHDMQTFSQQQKSDGKKIGFVPTMGFLHKGHLSLVEEAKKRNEIVVVSIFVNPTQFGEGEDFDIYPKDFERDKEMLENMEVDVIFYPTVDEIYPKSYNTYVDVYGVTDKLCGASRPGHFRGVTTVVSKLFNCVLPDNAYFGLKDAQQVVVISKMARELHFPVNIVPCPIVRESDGLALSSRNVNLTKEQREHATVLYKSLKKAEEMIEDGCLDANQIKQVLKDEITTYQEARLDYIEVVDFDTLEDVKTIQGKTLLALAVKIGKVRLIDNLIVEV